MTVDSFATCLCISTALTYKKNCKWTIIALFIYLTIHIVIITLNRLLVIEVNIEDTLPNIWIATILFAAYYSHVFCIKCMEKGVDCANNDS